MRIDQRSVKSVRQAKMLGTSWIAVLALAARAAGSHPFRQAADATVVSELPGAGAEPPSPPAALRRPASWDELPAGVRTGAACVANATSAVNERLVYYALPRSGPSRGG